MEFSPPRVNVINVKIDEFGSFFEHSDTIKIYFSDWIGHKLQSDFYKNGDIFCYL